METSNPKLESCEPELWLPEGNPLRQVVIGKLGEEAAELSKICHRIAIQGLESRDPETQKPNWVSLQEEIADVRALAILANVYLDLDTQSILDRMTKKKAMKNKWFQMIIDHFRLNFGHKDEERVVLR